MTTIDSFLQKRRMREHHYGIIMIITAYILSMLMLLLGSDFINGVKFSAAGVEKIEEETEESDISPMLGYSYYSNSRYILHEELLNPYKLKDYAAGAENEPLAVEEEQNINTLWFLGTEMNDEQFDRLMLEAGDILEQVAAKREKLAENEDKAKEAVKAAAKAKEEVKEDKETVYTVKVASYNKVITVTEEDVKMLERITQAEASGEDIKGKILIVNVILNRVASDKFPNTIKKVIFQKNDDGDYQFSPVKSGKYWKVKVTQETKKAVLRALEGEDYSKGALYFMARKYAKPKNAKWFDDNLQRLFKHGGHEFFK